jgi:hypothetical protein
MDTPMFIVNGVLVDPDGKPVAAKASKAEPKEAGLEEAGASGLKEEGKHKPKKVADK